MSRKDRGFRITYRIFITILLFFVPFLIFVIIIDEASASFILCLEFIPILICFVFTIAIDGWCYDNLGKGVNQFRAEINENWDNMIKSIFSRKFKRKYCIRSVFNLLHLIWDLILCIFLVFRNSPFFIIISYLNETVLLKIAKNKWFKKCLKWLLLLFVTILFMFPSVLFAQFAMTTLAAFMYQAPLLTNVIPTVANLLLYIIQLLNFLGSKHEEYLVAITSRIRQDIDKNLREQEKDTLSKQEECIIAITTKIRQDIDKNIIEQDIDTLSKQEECIMAITTKIRQDIDKNLREQDKDTLSKQEECLMAITTRIRQDINQNKREQDKDTLSKQEECLMAITTKIRQDIDKNLREQDKDTLSKQEECLNAITNKIRQDIDKNLPEQDKDTLSKQEKCLMSITTRIRQDFDKNILEQDKDTLYFYIPKTQENIKESKELLPLTSGQEVKIKGCIPYFLEGDKICVNKNVVFHFMSRAYIKGLVYMIAILAFLASVSLMVFAIGRLDYISTSNQFFFTLVTGVIPLLLNEGGKVRSALSSPTQGEREAKGDTNKTMNDSHFDERIKTYKETWVIDDDDDEPIEGINNPVYEQEHLGINMNDCTHSYQM